MLGHNNGPPIGDITDVGGLMRQYCWRKAHKKAWRTPPIEIAKLRSRAAEQLGLSYRDYSSILMDRGHRPRAIFFGLGGTLVRTRNNEMGADRDGAAILMPGVREKLRRLGECALFIIAEGTHAPETVGRHIHQLNQACGGRIIDHMICNALDSVGRMRKPEPAMISHLLVKHGIPPSQAFLVGDTAEDEKCADEAKLARFFWAWHYFAESTMAQA